MHHQQGGDSRKSQILSGGGGALGPAISPDGTYRAPGVRLGRSKVVIETLPFNNITPQPEIASQRGGLRVTYVASPPKHEKPETTDLRFDVERGKEFFEIELR
jgi:hypothetical protein